MTVPVRDALEDFIRRAKALSPAGDLPRVPFDPEWVSPCQIGQPDADGRIRWRPVPQHEPVSFAGLENALEVGLHPDIKDYFGSFWSAGLEASCEEGPVTLIQLWNADDFERLVGNFIGHALAKRRERRALTFFFATTDPDSELFLSIDNESGQVLLEEPGRAPRRVVDDNLAQFIARLTPSDVPQRIY